eukprot:6716588-Prymnesium_polylepis.1
MKKPLKAIWKRRKGEKRDCVDRLHTGKSYKAPRGRLGIPRHRALHAVTIIATQDCPLCLALGVRVADALATLPAVRGHRKAPVQVPMLFRLHDDRGRMRGPTERSAVEQQNPEGF